MFSAITSLLGGSTPAAPTASTEKPTTPKAPKAAPPPTKETTAVAPKPEPTAVAVPPPTLTAPQELTNARQLPQQAKQKLSSAYESMVAVVGPGKEPSRQEVNGLLEQLTPVVRGLQGLVKPVATAKAKFAQLSDESVEEGVLPPSATTKELGAVLKELQGYKDALCSEIVLLNAQLKKMSGASKEIQESIAIEGMEHLFTLQQVLERHQKQNHWLSFFSNDPALFATICKALGREMPQPPKVEPPREQGQKKEPTPTPPPVAAVLPPKEPAKEEVKPPVEPSPQSTKPSDGEKKGGWSWW